MGSSPADLPTRLDLSAEVSLHGQEAAQGSNKIKVALIFIINIIFFTET